ncbi:hypothetical protein ACLOJK_014644 [Asimina triloba]
MDFNFWPLMEDFRSSGWAIDVVAQIGGLRRRQTSDGENGRRMAIHVGHAADLRIGKEEEMLQRRGAAGRRARCCVSPPCSPPSLKEEGRSWICNHDMVVILSNGSNHPIGASSMVGYVVRFLRKIGWWDRVQRVVSIILGGLDRPSAPPPESSSLAAMKRVMEHRIWCSSGAS